MDTKNNSFESGYCFKVVSFDDFFRTNIFDRSQLNSLTALFAILIYRNAQMNITLEARLTYSHPQINDNTFHSQHLGRGSQIVVVFSFFVFNRPCLSYRFFNSDKLFAECERLTLPYRQNEKSTANKNFHIFVAHKRYHIITCFHSPFCS